MFLKLFPTSILSFQQIILPISNQIKNFFNDLFPKDWNAFLIGRDIEYLKAPSDSVRILLFNPTANLDLIYTPRFDSDRYIDGSRASYFNTTLGQIAGTDVVVHRKRPNNWFQDNEIALRLYRNLAAYEQALYGYRGFWKSPGGMNLTTGRSLFPDLTLYGASIRGPLAGGIANAERGYYDSRDDGNGKDPMINNSEQHLLLGYEHHPENPAGNHNPADMAKNESKPNILTLYLLFPFR